MKHIMTFNENTQLGLINRPNIDISTPCALYNADKKELIGLFNSRQLASKYIYGTKTKLSNISVIINKKTRIRASSNLLNVTIAGRNLNDNQKELLGNKPFVIVGDYKQPPKGFADPREYKTEKDEDFLKRKALNSVASISKTRKKTMEMTLQNKNDREILHDYSPVNLRGI